MFYKWWSHFLKKIPNLWNSIVISKTFFKILSQRLNKNLKIMCKLFLPSTGFLWLRLEVQPCQCCWGMTLANLGQTFFKLPKTDLWWSSKLPDTDRISPVRKILSSVKMKRLFALLEPKEVNESKVLSFQKSEILVNLFLILWNNLKKKWNRRLVSRLCVHIQGTCYFTGLSTSEVLTLPAPVFACRTNGSICLLCPGWSCSTGVCCGSCCRSPRGPKSCPPEMRNFFRCRSGIRHFSTIRLWFQMEQKLAVTSLKIHLEGIVLTVLADQCP